MPLLRRQRLRAITMSRHDMRRDDGARQRRYVVGCLLYAVFMPLMFTPAMSLLPRRYVCHAADATSAQRLCIMRFFSLALL